MDSVTQLLQHHLEDLPDLKEPCSFHRVCACQPKALVEAMSVEKFHAKLSWAGAEALRKFRKLNHNRRVAVARKVLIPHMPPFQEGDIVAADFGSHAGGVIRLTCKSTEYSEANGWWVTFETPSGEGRGARADNCTLISPAKTAKDPNKRCGCGGGSTHNAWCPTVGGTGVQAHTAFPTRPSKVVPTIRKAKAQVKDSKDQEVLIWAKKMWHIALEVASTQPAVHAKTQVEADMWGEFYRIVNEAPVSYKDGGERVTIPVSPKLVQFMYDLLHSHMAAGLVEDLISQANDPRRMFAKGWLAKHAETLARKLEGKQG